MHFKKVHRYNFFDHVMRILFIIYILLAPTANSIAQIDRKVNEQTHEELRLEHHLPLFVRPYRLNLCTSTSLISTLRDSLTEEGFTLIDSAQYISIIHSFLRDQMFSNTEIRDLKGKSEQEIKELFLKKVSNKKIAQELSIENISCLDTLHNYTIRLYLFPRPAKENTKTLSFTLPFNSPYRISDIILSLIEREPAKK